MAGGRCREHVLPISCLVGLLLLVVLPAVAADEAGLRKLLAIDEGRLRVDAISPHILTGSGLTRKSFDAWLQSGMPHYAVETNDSIVVKAVVSVISGIDLELSNVEPDRVDIRYRIQFATPEKPTVTLYADPWGYVILGDRVFRARTGGVFRAKTAGRWLAPFWKALRSENRYR